VWAPACLVDEGLLDKLTEQLPVVASCRPRLILRHQDNDHLLLRVIQNPVPAAPAHVNSPAEPGTELSPVSLRTANPRPNV